MTRRERYADPSERVRFGSMRYIPSLALSNINPDVFHAATIGGQNDAPLPTTAPFYQGQAVWVTYFGGAGDAPAWVMNDGTTVDFGAGNIEGGVSGEISSSATVKAWTVVVPATAKAVRIGIGPPHTAALVMWLMPSVNAAKMGDGSSQPAPDHFVPSVPRAQAYVIAGCVSLAPSMDTVPAFDMGVGIDNQRALLGATHNTPGVLFPVTYGGPPSGRVGFYQWATDSQPPIVT